VKFSIRIKRSAAKELARIPVPDRQRIVKAIDGLERNPFQGETLKGQLLGLRRIRAGSYRVLFEVQEDVLVVRVSHRKNACRT